MFSKIRLGSSRLTKEITLSLIIKIIALITIWYLFFSHPVADSLTPDSIRHRILGSAHSTNNNIVLHQPNNIVC